MRTTPIADDGTLGADDGRELVLFVHGMWLHSSSWREWSEEFDRAGYQHRSFRWPGELPTAPAWRAVDRAPSLSIDGLLHELAGLVHPYRSKPIVIGHGTGGLLAEILLGKGVARAAISITPLPTGMATVSSVLRSAVMPQSAFWSAIRPGSVTPTIVQFRDIIANATGGEEAARLYDEHVTPGQPRSLLTSLPRTARVCHSGGPAPDRRGPLLLISAAEDRLIHESSISALHRQYRRKYPGAVTDYQVFLGRAHSLTIDVGWRSVAYYCLDWLTRQNL